jgi:hypothetical protein
MTPKAHDIRHATEPGDYIYCRTGRRPGRLRTQTLSTNRSGVMGTMRGQYIITSLTVLTLALAHSDDEHGGEHNMHTHPVPASNVTSGDEASYYFAYEPHKGWLYLHIFAMVVAWVFVMPIGK